MTVSSISSNLATQFDTGLQSMQQRRQSFQQLGQALDSGDLAAAQSAYSAIEKTLPQGQSSQTGSGTSDSSGSPLQQDFAALGQALANGDLSGAQSDYSKIQDDLKATQQNIASALQGSHGAHRGHHRHHSADAANSTASSGNSTDGTSSSTTSTGTTGGTLNLIV